MLALRANYLPFPPPLAECLVARLIGNHVKVDEKCFQYPDVYSLLRRSASNPLQPSLHDQYNEFQQDNIEPYPGLRIYVSRSASCQRLSNHGHHNRETSGNSNKRISNHKKKAGNDVVICLQRRVASVRLPCINLPCGSF